MNFDDIIKMTIDNKKNNNDNNNKHCYDQYYQYRVIMVMEVNFVSIGRFWGVTPPPPPKKKKKYQTAGYANGAIATSIFMHIQIFVGTFGFLSVQQTNKQGYQGYPQNIWSTNKDKKAIAVLECENEGGKIKLVRSAHSHIFTKIFFMLVFCI